MKKPIQKVLILVHTEYHMMVALSIIADHYADPDQFAVTLYQVQDYGGRRFRFEKETDLSPHIQYRVISYEDREFRYNADIVNATKDILGEGYKIFLMFNSHAFFPAYLAKRLYRQGTSVLLCPDGLKPYSNTDKASPRWSLTFMWKFYKFVRANRLPFEWYFPKLVYAGMKEIGGVYLSFPDGYKNISKKQIKTFALMASPAAIALVNKYFRFDVAREMAGVDKVLFYINQPISKVGDLQQFDEAGLLLALRNQFPDYRVVIKLHPTVEPSQKERFLALGNVELITQSYPAELYIAELKDSLVISLWSTACMLDNPATRAYWLHPMLSARNLMPAHLKIINPTTHVREVKAIESIL